MEELEKSSEEKGVPEIRGHWSHRIFFFHRRIGEKQATRFASALKVGKRRDAIRQAIKKCCFFARIACCFFICLRKEC
jgi:hypothetical protein